MRGKKCHNHNGEIATAKEVRTMDEDQLNELEQDTSVDSKPAGIPLTPEDEELLAKYEYTFNGTFLHSLDSKGRMIVPSSFRSLLGETFCIAPSRDFKSVALYPNIIWARLRDSYAKLGAFNPKLNEFLENFDALTYRAQECDNQGRVLLPARIRELILKSEKDVEIKGSHDHVKIAIRKKADEKFANFMDNIDDTLDAIAMLSMQCAQLDK